MTRYDYARSTRTRPRLRELLHLAGAARGPLLGGGLALICLALASFVENARIGELDARFADLHAHYVAAEPAGARVATVTAAVERLRALRDALAAARRTSSGDLDELTLLGNRLPRPAWLTGVRAERAGSWSLEGRALSVADVGSVLNALARLDPSARLRLVALSSGSTPHAALHFTIGFEHPK